MTERLRLYYTTPLWRERSKRVIERAGHACERCGKGPFGLVAHHITYENVFFEGPYDLMCLCSDCHTQVHAAINALKERLLFIRAEDRSMPACWALEKDAVDRTIITVLQDLAPTSQAALSLTRSIEVLSGHIVPYMKPRRFRKWK